MLKFLFILVVFLSVPLFFVVVIVGGIYNRLNTLRARTRLAFNALCRELGGRNQLSLELAEAARPRLSPAQQARAESVRFSREAMASALAQLAETPTDSQAMASLAEANGALTVGLERLKNVSGSEPGLQESWLKLSVIEDQLAAATADYQESLARYNDTLKKFRLVGPLIGFHPAPGFKPREQL